MSYNPEFRKFVVSKIKDGMLQSEAMEFFNISRDSIYRWMKKESETGGLEDSPRKEYKVRKVDSQALLEEVRQNPDATLEELAEKFNCWPHAIFRRLKKLGITRKKNHAIHRAGRGKKATI